MGGTTRAAKTLWLTTILHAFTHAYGAMLVPLYLLMVADLHLPGVKRAGLVVTVYMLVYAFGSYAAGVLADRWSRRNLLGYGLLLNSAAIAMMGLTRSYPTILLLAVLAGLAGTLFHPAANSLIPAHFPKSPGMAIGLLGMGSGIGFFVGPQYAGWRAQTAQWRLWHVAGWQKPCVEVGAAGIVFAFIFLLLAREARPQRTPEQLAAGEHPRVPPAMRRKVLLIAVVLGCRDFAGIASFSLSSIYLQKALGYGAAKTGLVLGTMMLLTIPANPLSVWLSPGKRRLPAMIAMLVIGGLVIATVPLWLSKYVLIVLIAYQVAHLCSYAISDAAILERVAANIRGRVVGLFLTIASTMAAISPWAMGFWTDGFGNEAGKQMRYMPPFITLGVLMIVAAFSAPIIAALGMPDEKAIDPLAEIDPATMAAVV
jgi:MFS family permease